VTDQIEFSSFFKLLNSIKEGESEKISLLDEQISEFKSGINSKNFLEELGAIYLSVGVTELYNFTNQKDLKSIGLIDKEEWENLSEKNQQELPVYLANKMIEGFGELFRQVSFSKIGTSAIQSRAMAALINTTYVFCLPGSKGACKDGWDEILQYQLDIRHRPCNFVEIMPRLSEK